MKWFEFNADHYYIVFILDEVVMKRFFIFLFLIWPILICHGQIVLTEVMFNPDGSDHVHEFVEIFNAGGQGEVDLTGWKIGDGYGEDELKDTGRGLILLSGQYGLILDSDYFGNSNLYDHLIPEGALVLTIHGTTLGSGGLSNSRPETVVIYDTDHEVHAEYAYTIGNAPGHSDEKVDAAGSDEPENWKDSSVFNGTPGFRNSVTPPDSSNLVRLSVAPNPFSPDADLVDDEARISFTFPASPSHVNLRIYDMRGRCIRTLMAAESSGYHGQVVWDGRDDRDRISDVGIYIIYIEGLCSSLGRKGSAKTTVVLAGRL